MLVRSALAMLSLLAGLIAMTGSATAQYYGNQGGFWGSGSRYGNTGYRRYSDPYADDERPRKRRYRDRYADDFEDDYDSRRNGRSKAAAELSDEVRSGGPRTAVSAKSPPRVRFVSNYKPGSIVIDQSARRLYYVMSDGSALSYPISVGREGFSWTGSEKVSRIADWPDWHPPEEMRERDPRLPMKMTGGINNPLGAKAIYLGNTLYRIHGTNDPKSIGRAASSGCFRMMNGHVMHLAGQIGVGTQVHVLKSLPKSVASSS